MKVAFDENIPEGMVRVFESLRQERRFRRVMLEVVTARTYTPKPSEADFIKADDSPWLHRFAADDGRVVISGDRRILSRPHELLALRQGGFIVFFFGARWSGWDFFQKSALLLFHWQGIAKRIRTAKPGMLFNIPSHWRRDGKFKRNYPLDAGVIHG